MNDANTCTQCGRPLTTEKGNPPRRPGVRNPPQSMRQECKGCPGKPKPQST